ncbi:hypothetical protein [Polyangium fumosum]|uniref:Secreted protein n=1 Tax=Polyangium fumosum TaxID=889272 RepID=A0A4U1JHQ5_9BACT|nr:hypothetical protein [Polyangium fumosum]TKD11940.1 hypothetical protein E8A74_07385 [Polyangium fumosum]
MNTQYVLKGLFVLVLLTSACGEENPPANPSGNSSSSGAGGGGGAGGSGGGGPECFSEPTSHVEIINACTEAEKVDKVVNLPLLNADGSLPPLP